MSKAEMENAVEIAREALQKNEEGRLLYKFRREIWKTFDDGEYGSEAGHRRRFELALMCVNRVVTVWERAFPNNDGVDNMIRLAKQAIASESEREPSRKSAYDYWSEVDSLDADTEAQLRGMSAGYAAITAVYVAARDEIINNEMEDDYDEDPFSWDTSFHAFLADTGFGGENPDSIEKVRGFWEWYLDKAVPQSYDSV